jgi:glycosyltransferase involved in cell wall biosynthesis
MMSVKISIVIPMYNERENVPLIMERVLATQPPTADAVLEWVLVDDGSRDDTGAELARALAGRSDVVILRLARNHGSHAAYAAGLKYTEGDIVVLLVADFQEDVELLASVLAAYKDGYEVIWSESQVRHRSPGLSVLGVSLYYALLRLAPAYSQAPTRAGSIRALSRRMVDFYLHYAPKNVNINIFFANAGFRQTVIRYTQKPRSAGTSKWTLYKKISLFRDTFVDVGDAPILLIWAGGALLMAGGVLALMVSLVSLLLGSFPALWIIAAVVILCAGVQTLGLAVLSEYVWRLLSPPRGLPRFTVDWVQKGDTRSYPTFRVEEER